MNDSLLNSEFFNAINDSGRFSYSGKVFMFKFLNQFFIVLLTNFSNFILLTIDGFVVSHFVGLDALNSVSLLNPFVLIVGALTSLLSTGTNFVLSKTYGIGLKDAIARLFKAIVLLTVFFLVGMAIIQIPLMHLMINAYTVSDNIKNMIRLYAVGLIIANSVSVINTVGSYMLIAAGRVKVLFKLTVLECTVNVLFDLLLVGPCNMGVLGAGLGTAISCTIRAVATIILVQKTLKLFPIEKVDCKEEMQNIMLNGFPQMSTMLLTSMSNYIMKIIIANYAGIDAITVISVCAVGTSLFAMISNSFVQTGSPLIGILVGSEDWEIAKDLGLKILKMCIITVSILVAAAIIFPQIFFTFYGINKYTNFQILSVRLYLLRFIPFAIASLFSSLCVYYEKRKIAIATNTIGALLLIPTFLLLMNINADLIFLCYVICASISATMLSITYINIVNKKVIEGKGSNIMHLCFNEDDSIDISKIISDFLTKNGTAKRIIYRFALAFEEIGAYVKSNKNKVNIFMSIRENKNSIRLFFIDDGKPAIMNKKLIATDLILGNYNLIEKLSSSFIYQNIAGLNNFIMTFDYTEEEKENAD